LKDLRFKTSSEASKLREILDAEKIDKEEEVPAVLQNLADRKKK